MIDKSVTMAMNGNKLTLPLIIGIPLLGIALTTLYYFFVTSYGIKLGTQNQGILITPPKQITELQVLDTKNNPHIWNNGQGRWTFIVPGHADCSEECQKKLYFVRQTHRALGKGALRVDTVYLNFDTVLSDETAALLKKEYSHFQVLHVDAPQAKAWIAQKSPVLDWMGSGNFYVVDPMGWVMMYYTDSHDYKSVIKDMKFLLKNS